MSPPSGGSRAPVRYFTDHKNLIYLRTAKLLNTCQTDGLCFSTVSTSPSLSTQVIKTLKLMLFPGKFAPDTDQTVHASVLPAACQVAFLSWGIEETIRQALQDEPDPGTGPAGCQYVPSAARATVIRW